MDGTGSPLSEEPGFHAEAKRDGNNSATVRLCGDLDIASAGAARRALEQLDAGIQQIVLDLSDITYCDAAGVRFLLTAQKQARTTGRDLVVRHPSRPVRRVLAITGELPAITRQTPRRTKHHNRQIRAIPPRRTHHHPTEGQNRRSTRLGLVSRKNDGMAPCGRTVSLAGRLA